MKAAVVEEPGRLVVREVPKPDRGEYDALCELLYGATCSGTDWHIIAGRFPFPVEYPTILGHESIGRVLEVGTKVRGYRPGDLVTRVGTPPVGGLNVNWGGFAEYGIARDHKAMKEDGLPRNEWAGHRVNQLLPPGTDPAAATMVITWRETLSYITRMGAGEGAGVLVLGSGGTGLSFAAHARNLGAGVVAMVGSAGRKTEGEALGVDAYLDYRTENLLSPLREVCPEGFEYIIDAVGKKGQMDRVLGALAPDGTIGIYGVDDFGATPINPGSARGSFTYSNRGYDEEETHDRVVALMQEGALDASVFLDVANPFPLAEIGSAFEAVRRRRAVKALVRLSGTS